MKRRITVVAFLAIILGAGAAALDNFTDGGLGQLSRAFAGRQRPNILLITVETFRRDHCSLYGYERDTTPFLRELAKESIVFDNGWSMSSWTYPSMACVLSGRGPEETGIWHAGCSVQGNILPWLQELGAAGYRLGAFTTNPSVHRLLRLRRKEWDCWNHSYRDADLLLGELTDWIKAGRAEPWFAFCHLIDPHSPYGAPEPFRDRYVSHYGVAVGDMPAPAWKQFKEHLPLTRDENQYMQDRYDAEIYYTDRALGRLRTRLQVSGQWENTCLILTGDHGEFFGEHGRWGHGGPPYPAVTQVPFLLHLPGGRIGGARIDALVGGIDVLPTLLTQAGVAVPDGLAGLDAVSLLEDARPVRILRLEHSTIKWQDAAETTYTPVCHTRAKVWGHLHSLSEVPIEPDRAGPQPGDAQVVADLRDLGYL